MPFGWRSLYTQLWLRLKSEKQLYAARQARHDLIGAAARLGKPHDK
jgi:hypothetical protein